MCSAPLRPLLLLLPLVNCAVSDIEGSGIIDETAAILNATISPKESSIFACESQFVNVTLVEGLDVIKLMGRFVSVTPLKAIMN